jgi:hypothetical protein
MSDSPDKGKDHKTGSTREQHGEWVVTEYLIGAAALMERLSAWPIARGIVGLVVKKHEPGYKVPWDKLDLSDVKKPRLLCDVNELEKFSHP